MTLPLTLLAALLLKSLLVCAAAGLLLVALRRSSAAARHLVCLWTLAALLSLPLFSLTLLARHLPVLSQLKPETEPTPVRPSPTLPVREGKELDQALTQTPYTVPTVASPSVSSPTGRTPAKQGGGFLLVFYAAGVVLASIRPLLGLRGIRRLRHNCAAVTDEPTLTTAADCARFLGVSLPCLCRADVPVPMTWGWHRPVVVLPDSAAEWPEGRLRSVLLHELAHVKRRDWPGHRLADLACAVYWFHPLVWLIARRLRAESEVACDDLVLASGIPAPDYARHLLAIAQTLPSVGRSPHSAIAMAQTSRIERRLLMLLDTTQSRRTLTRRVLLAALIPSAAALVGLAVLRPTAKAQAAPQDAAGASHGIKLLGVSNAAEMDSTWWNENGAAVSASTPKLDQGRVKATASPGQKALFIAFQLPAELRNKPLVFDVPGTAAPGITITSPKSAVTSRSLALSLNSGLAAYGAAFPVSLTKTDVHIGIASGLGTETVNCPKMPGKVHFEKPSGKVTFTLIPNPHHLPAAQAARGYAVFMVSDHFRSPSPLKADNPLQTALHDGENYERAVYMLDRRGRIVAKLNVLPHTWPDALLQPADYSSMKTQQLTYIPNFLLKRVVSFRLVARPYQWTKFKDVALQPSVSSAASAVPTDASAEGTENTVDAQFGQKEALRLSQAQQIRDHLTGWAQANKAALVQMQRARPDDLVALMRVYSSLIKQPFPLWSGDPRVGRATSVISSYVPDPTFSTQTVALTLSHLERSQEPTDKSLREDFARYHDFRIARSVDPGRTSIVVWASGRITQSTVSDRFTGHGKPILQVTSEKSITPPFFP